MTVPLTREERLELLARLEEMMKSSLKVESDWNVPMHHFRSYILNLVSQIKAELN